MLWLQILQKKSINELCIKDVLVATIINKASPQAFFAKTYVFWVVTVGVPSLRA